MPLEASHHWGPGFFNVSSLLGYIEVSFLNANQKNKNQTYASTFTWRYMKSLHTTNCTVYTHTHTHQKSTPYQPFAWPIPSHLFLKRVKTKRHGAFWHATSGAKIQITLCTVLVGVRPLAGRVQKRLKERCVVIPNRHAGRLKLYI